MVQGTHESRVALFDHGAVAQLGERQNRTLEVGGSSPLCSTSHFSGDMVSAVSAGQTLRICLVNPLD